MGRCWIIGYCMGFLLFLGCTDAPTVEEKQDAFDELHLSEVEGDVPPDEAVKKIYQKMAEGDLAAYWEMLPPKYHEDTEALLEEFANKMDGEVWSEGFATADQLTEVLRNKQEYILGHPLFMMSGVSTEDAAEHWNSLVEFLAILTHSDVSDLNKLKEMDPGVFLSDTGGRLMQQAEGISKMFPGDPINEKIENMTEVKVEVLEETEEEATVRILVEGEDPREEKLIKVEGQWVPAKMADEWEQMIEQAQEAIEDIKLEDKKEDILAQMKLIKNFLESLEEAESQEEFNTMIDTTMQGIGKMIPQNLPIPGMGSGPGMTGPGMSGPPLDVEIEEEPTAEDSE
ncbi:Hypothetical protein PBC10988_21630 [Planctomycetales bacterium 10988]|nr:Hypothetical protein PBC10988_21630 [Planctomycetales bacterium 10988]